MLTKIIKIMIQISSGRANPAQMFGMATLRGSGNKNTAVAGRLREPQISVSGVREELQADKHSVADRSF